MFVLHEITTYTNTKKKKMINDKWTKLVNTKKRKPIHNGKKFS